LSLQARFEVPGQYEYEAPLAVCGGLSDQAAEGAHAETGTAAVGDADGDSEVFNGDGSGTEESSGADLWGVLTLTKRPLPQREAERYVSPSNAFAAQPAGAEEEPPVDLDVNGHDGPSEYGGAAAQFDGRVADIYFIHDSDEPDGGEEQNEGEWDDVYAYADEPDDGDGLNGSELGSTCGDDREGAEEQNEYGFDDPFGDDQHDDVLRL
jgi:hypothetical protein